jgi:hypothetical protein
MTALCSYTVAVEVHLVGFGYDQKEENKKKYMYLVGTLAVVLIIGTITSYFY